MSNFLKSISLLGSLSLFAFGQGGALQSTFGGNQDERVYLAASSESELIYSGYTYSFEAVGQDIFYFKSDTQGNLVWSVMLGGEGDDWATGLLRQPDGTFILSGRTTSFGNGGVDIFFACVDSLGQVLKFKTYGGPYEDRSMGVINTSDGNYLMYGSTKSGNLGNLDIILLKVNASGDLIWSRTYGGANTDVAYSVKETVLGDFIVFAYTNSWEGIFSTDGYIMKIDMRGDLIWTKNYGGSGFEYITWSSSTKIDSNGDIIIAGYTDSFGAGGMDQLLIRFNQDGDLLWSKTLGGLGDDYANSVIITEDKSIIISGSVTNPETGDWDAHLAKFTADGGHLWSKTYGGHALDGMVNIYEREDRSLLGIGRTYSFGQGGMDVYLIQMDSLGNNECNQRSFDPVVSSPELLVWAGNTYQGAILLEVSEIDPTIISSKNDINIISADVCNTTTTAQSIPGSFRLNQNFPNPFNPNTIIEYEIPEQSEVSLIIYDIAGRVVQTLVSKQQAPGIHQVEWNGMNGEGKQVSGGMYFARLITDEYSSVIEMLLLR